MRLGIPQQAVKAATFILVSPLRCMYSGTYIYQSRAPPSFHIKGLSKFDIVLCESKTVPARFPFDVNNVMTRAVALWDVCLAHRCLSLEIAKSLLFNTYSIVALLHASTTSSGSIWGESRESALAQNYTFCLICLEVTNLNPWVCSEQRWCLGFANTHPLKHRHMTSPVKSWNCHSLCPKSSALWELFLVL